MRADLLLAGLEARRTAPLGLAALVFGLAFLAARFGGATEVEPALAGLEGLDQGASVVRGAARASGAVLGLTVAALASVTHAAGLAARWRQGDGDWLGARPIGRARALGASFGGLALGIAVLVAAVFGATALSGAEPAGPLLWRGGPAANYALAPGAAFQAAFDDLALPPVGSLRVRVQNTALDVPYGDVRLAVLVATAGAGGEVHVSDPVSVVRRVARRGYIEVDLPQHQSNRGKLQLDLTALGPGTLAVIGPQPVELFGPARRGAWVDLALALRSLGLVLGAAALAVGFGAWVAPPLALLLALASCVLTLALLPEAAPALGERLGAFWPGAGLGAAFELAAEGRAPDRPSPAQLAGLGVLVAGGLGLARLALGSWRHAP